MKKFLAILLLLPFFSVADDTEIYITKNIDTDATTQPNVLLILDSSGSMDGDIVTVEDYDPSIIYPGTPTNNYYLYDNNGYIPWEGEDDPPIDIECLSAKDYLSDPANKDTPYYEDKYAFLRGAYYWRREYRANTRVISCKSDSQYSPARYLKIKPVNDDDRYTTNASKEISWNNKYTYKLVTSNYHRYLQSGPEKKTTKNKAMIDAAKTLIDDFDRLNVGLMRFNYNSGGYVLEPFMDITQDANKKVLKAAINNIPTDDWTPLNETLEEASRYYRGQSPKYGRSEGNPAAESDGKYKSPIVEACQKNYIVLLTDGQPREDQGSDNFFNAGLAQGDIKIQCRSSWSSPTHSSHTCLDETAQWLYETDHSTASVGQTNLSGDQTVSTYTIGFDVKEAKELLTTTASKGGGAYYEAENASALSDAFSDIFIRILSNSGIFSAPAVSVNAYNNLRHREEIYYALFSPDDSQRWAGDVKKFNIKSDGNIYDKNNSIAIDPLTGFFNKASHSIWAENFDGELVSNGGFSENIPEYSSRFMYSNLTSNNDLTASGNRVNTINVAPELLALDSSEEVERDDIIDWALGRDSGRYFAADPLHNRPVVITYGGDESSPEDVVFTATNQGLVHAIDAQTGIELYAFIPKDMLPNLTTYYNNDVLSDNKIYGLDGPMSFWKTTAVGEVTPSSVHLYIGMRRGGNNYYALDVSDKLAPKFKWQITPATEGFSNLGQTWSTAKKAVVHWKCPATGCTESNQKDVLIFGGGYDPIHDTATAQTIDDQGSSVYMVDADTGELLWSAGSSDEDNLTLSAMQHSMAADISIIDFDGDGVLDLAYSVDILGKLWRFDFNDAPRTAAEFASGGVIADLSASFTVDDTTALRRFYYAPDISYQGTHFAITLASGFRANPLNNLIQDRMYTIFDHNISGAPAKLDDDGEPVVPAQVEYISVDEYAANGAENFFDATHSSASFAVNDKGWFIDFSTAGEKVLSETTIQAGSIYFTSYIPATVGSAQCGPGIGTGRLYVRDVDSGASTLSDKLEFIELKAQGIPSTAAIIYTKQTHGEGEDEVFSSKPIVCVGTECFDVIDESPLKRSYWKESNE